MGAANFSGLHYRYEEQETVSVADHHKRHFSEVFRLLHFIITFITFLL